MMTRIALLRVLLASSVLFVACGGSGDGEHPARFRADGDIVVDGDTKLSWQRNLRSAAISWNDASDYCGSAADGGRVWRLPSRKELLSVMPAVRNDEMPINLTADELGWFWTSASNDIDSNYAELCSIQSSCSCRTDTKAGDVIESSYCGSGTCFTDVGDIPCPTKSEATVGSSTPGKPPRPIRVWCVSG